MRFLSVVATACLLSACAAAPGTKYSNHVVHEKRDGIPHQWGKRDRAAAHEMLPIRIGLRQRNLEHAERFIYDVSDPNSPNFGRSPCSLSISIENFLTTTSVYRQALDCRAGRQHFRPTSGDQRLRDQLVGRVWHRPLSYLVLDW